MHRSFWISQGSLSVEMCVHGEYKCLYACMSACVCTCVHLCSGILPHEYVCGGQRLKLSMFLYHFPVYALRQGLSLNLLFTNSGRLTRQQGPEILPSASMLQMCTATSGGLCGFLESDHGLSHLPGKHFPYWAVFPWPFTEVFRLERERASLKATDKLRFCPKTYQNYFRKTSFPQLIRYRISVYSFLLGFLDFSFFCLFVLFCSISFLFD